jgi:spore germination cell wall hydrolase CwlJ-like protein
MKTLMTITVLSVSANSAFAIWTEKASESGINVTHCIQPGVDSVKCIRNMKLKPEQKAKTQKLVKVSKEKPVKAIQTVISDKDIKMSGHGVDTSTKDIKCLAYSIFREAGNQKVVDQYAVGQIHVNRLKEGSWGKTMCKVVYAKAQFSWTLETKVVVWSKKQEEHFTDIAEGLLMDGVYVKKLASNKILHYHATYVKPKWAKQGQMVASAGEHMFYKNVPF